MLLYNNLLISIVQKIDYIAQFYCVYKGTWKKITKTIKYNIIKVVFILV